MGVYVADVGRFDQERAQAHRELRLLVYQVVAASVAVASGQSGQSNPVQLFRPTVELVGGEGRDDGAGFAVDLAAIPGGSKGFLVHLAAGLLPSGDGVFFHPVAEFREDGELGVEPRCGLAGQVGRHRVACGFERGVGRQRGERGFLDYTDGVFSEKLTRFGFQNRGLGVEREAG